MNTFEQTSVESYRPVISTSEFNRLLSTNDKDELCILIGSDLSRVEFQGAAHLSQLNSSRQLNLSRTLLDQADLYQAEIANCQFTNASLRGVNLSRSTLTNVDFTNADLSGANLAYAILVNCNLKNANFCNANLEGVDLDGIGFRSRDKALKLENTHFEGAILRKANLRGYNPYHPKHRLDLSTVNFNQADLAGAIYDSHTRFPVGFDANEKGALLITAGISLENADLSFTNLFRANLSGANLSGVNLTGTRINSANLAGANLTGALITYEKGEWDKDLYGGVHLNHAILQKAKIIGIKARYIIYLHGVDFREVYLINCAFINSDLNGAKFTNMNLNGFDFSNAKLIGADFSGASLRGCNFVWADLQGVDFTGADLSGVNLSHANLENTDLSQATLSGVNLSNARLDGAKMPD